MTPQACPLCGQREAKLVFSYDEPDAYELAVGVKREGYARAWVRCAECNLHYSRYSREPDRLDRIYDRAYRDAGHSFRPADAEATFRAVIALPPEQSESVQRAHAILDTVERLQAQAVLEPWEERPRRLLDVGGASGVFGYVFGLVAAECATRDYVTHSRVERQELADLDTQRADAWSVEIVDPSAQGRFIEAHGVTYHQRRFDCSFDARPFHLISMNYLLEHVADPGAVLAAARGHLVASGLLYVEVPDEIAFRRVSKHDDIFNSCHLWMFGPDSLLQLLDAADFEPLAITRSRSPRGHFSLSVLAGCK